MGDIVLWIIAAAFSFMVMTLVFLLHVSLLWRANDLANEIKCSIHKEHLQPLTDEILGSNISWKTVSTEENPVTPTYGSPIVYHLAPLQDYQLHR